MKSIHESKEKLSNFTYRGKNLLKATENILIWKAIHGISMRALSDTLLTSLLPPDTINLIKPISLF